MTTEARIILTAQDRTGQAFRSAQAQLAGMSSAVKKVNSVLGQLGVGLSIGALVVGITSAAKAAIEFGDQMQKAAAKTGISASRFALLADAAKLADIDVSSLSTAFKKMQVAVSQAGSGAESALGAFKALGIQFEQFRKLNPEQQFLQIADQINKLQDPADRVRASVELFGKAGADLLPFFEQGADGIRQATAEIERMGGALSEDQIKKLADADQAIKELDQAWNALARTLTAQAAPALTRWFRIMAEGLKIQDMWLTPSQFLEKAIANADRGPGATPGATGSWGGGATGSWGGKGAPAPGYKAAPARGRKRTAAELAGLSDILITAHQITVGATEQMYRDMDAATQTAMEKQLAEWQAYDAQVQELVNSGIISAGEGAKRIAENNATILEPITITAEKVFPKAERKQLSEFWIQASRNTQDILAQFLLDPFKDGLKGLLQSFGDMLKQMAAQAIAADITSAIFGNGMGSGSGLLGQFLGIAGSYMGGGGGGIGLSSGQLAGAYGDIGALSSLPHYAKGGYLGPGRWGIAGENGPERIFGGKTGVSVQPASGGVNVTNHFVISAPQGTISRATQQQIAAAAGRGLAAVSARNN